MTNRKARFELLLIGIVALVFAILELYIDSFERLVVWAAQNESLLVTELFTLTLVLAIGLSIYAFRRWREAIALESDKLLLQQTVDTEKDRRRLMHSYAEAVMAGQEAERQRLARELHDDTIQRLILLNQKAGLAAFDHADSGAADDLQKMQSVIDETIGHVRHFIQELRPPYLDELGLTMALRALIKQTREHSDYLIEFEVSGETRRLGEATELALYRIAQSALGNAVQHSDATFIEVLLQFSAETVQLIVRDDGVGFEIESDHALVKAGHFGLVGMRERAELLGAQYHIASTPAHGTELTITVAD